MLGYIYFILMFIFLLYFYNSTIKIKNNSSNNNYNIYSNAAHTTKILVLIPAHNEEKIIKETIKKIYEADYPKELISIAVIADRCSDNTINLSKSEGAYVFSNLINKNKNKGSIIESFFIKYKNMIKKYDMICFIDADTFVEKNFFNVVDYEYKNGIEVVQGKIIISNNDKNIMSGFNIILQSFINNYFFKILSIEKKSVLLAGKGFCISSRILSEIDIRTKSLIEDVELSFKLLLENNYIHYCEDMKVFCLQPNNYADSFMQQRRWISGQLDICKTFFLKIFKCNFIFSGVTLFTNVCYINIIAAISILFFIYKSYFLFFGIYYIIAYVCSYISSKIDKNISYLSFKSYAVFPFIFIFWLLIYIFCIVKPEKNWKPINHYQ